MSDPNFEDFDHEAHMQRAFELPDFGHDEPSVRSATILDGVTDVVGPVLNDEGQRIHHEFD